MLVTMLEIVQVWPQIYLKLTQLQLLQRWCWHQFFSQDFNLMIYSLAIGGACIITSIIGTWFVRLGKSKNIMGALYKGFIVTAITSLIIMYPVTNSIVGINSTYNNNSGAIFTGFDLYICGVVGFVITGLLIWVTEYYTGQIIDQ